MIVGKKDTAFDELFGRASLIGDHYNDWFATSLRLEKFFERNIRFGGDFSIKEVLGEVLKQLLEVVSTIEDCEKLLKSFCAVDSCNKEKIYKKMISLCTKESEIVNLLNGDNFHLVDHRGLIEMCYKRLDELKAENKTQESFFGGKASGS